MRFDDSLDTVLATDASTPSGAHAVWRQLVDLIGRGRAAPTRAAIDRLRSLRPRVPAAVRAASARALAFARPPGALVALFVEDEFAIAAPVLRTAVLSGETWRALLVPMGTSGRAILRHRRDLPGDVVQALAGFGPADFVIAADPAASEAAPPELMPPAVPDPAGALPAVADAMRGPAPLAPAPGAFPIPEIVARIDAYRRRREEDAAAPTDPGGVQIAEAPAHAFVFETDAHGIVQWVEGVERAPIIGVSIDYGAGGGVEVDGVVRGAYRNRAPFSDARLTIGGASPAAGEWRVSAVPCFDRARGHFLGYRGSARRPRADQRAEAQATPADSLRQLAHELRTPTTAIAGFAEMIEQQVLGPVATPYRGYATTIVDQAKALLAAIDDLDIASRIEARALDLRPSPITLAPLVAQVVAALTPLAQLRGASISAEIADAIGVIGDDRAVERLFSRLIAALVSAAAPGEVIAIKAVAADAEVAIRLTRPRALAAIDAAPVVEEPVDQASAGAPLLGTGFALRLARNLARELGGSLMIAPGGLTLRLPAAFADAMDEVVRR